MGDQGRSEAILQPLAPHDFSLVMDKSRANRLTFAAWLIFFRDHGRFSRGTSDLAQRSLRAPPNLGASTSWWPTPALPRPRQSRKPLSSCGE